MSSTNKVRRQWEQDPHCVHCGQPTVMVTALHWYPRLGRLVRGGRPPDNAATVEYTADTGRVLACFGCNHNKGAKKGRNGKAISRVGDWVSREQIAELREIAEAVPSEPWLPLKAEATYSLAEATFLSRLDPMTVLDLIAALEEQLENERP